MHHGYNLTSCPGYYKIVILYTLSNNTLCINEIKRQVRKTKQNKKILKNKFV